MGSLLKHWPLIVVAASGLVGAWGFEQWKGRLRAEGRAEIYAAQVDSLAEAEAEARALVELVDQQATARILQAEAARDSAERTAERARSRRPEIVERIVHAPDTTAVRAAVEELEEAHDEEVTALRSVIAVSDSIMAAQREQIAARDERLRVQAALVATLQAQVGAVSQSRPGFIERWGGRIVAVGVGVGVGYVLAR